MAHDRAMPRAGEGDGAFLLPASTIMIARIRAKRKGRAFETGIAQEWGKQAGKFDAAARIRPHLRQETRSRPRFATS
jgi:hypothetical protein